MLPGPLQRSNQVLIAWAANALEKGGGFKAVSMFFSFFRI
jgi:hypothetical protein